MKLYRELIKARIEQVAAAISGVAKGLISYTTGTNKLYIDTGSDPNHGAKEIMIRETLAGDLGPYGTANPIQPLEGGTGLSSFTGQDGKVLVINETGGTYDLVDSADFAGGGSGVGSPDTLFVHNAEDQNLGDAEWTNNNWSISQTDPINGEDVFFVVHDNALNRELKNTIAIIPPKFRGKNVTMTLDLNSGASTGNVTLTVVDETNTATLVNAQQLTIVSGVTTSTKSQVRFDVPANCLSVSYELIALPEAGSPETRVDDISFALTTTEVREITATIQETNTFAARIANNGTASVASQSESFINTVTRSALGTVDVVFKTSFFSTVPSVVVTPSTAGASGNDKDWAIHTVTSNGFTCQIQGVSPVVFEDTDFDIQVTRQGSDYKNIEKRVEREVSTFKEVIQETDNIVVVGEDNGGETITANVTDIPFTLIEDNSGGWNGTIYTVPENGIYAFSGSVNKTDSLGLQINLYVNGVHKQLLGGTSNSTVVPFSGTSELTAGEQVSLRCDVTKTLSSGSPVYHNLYISKVGVPKIAQVAPDSKIDIPTSELRMLGSTGRGTGAEATTVIYSAISKIRGSAITVDNSNGTVITVVKDGLLNVSANTKMTASSTVMISLNASDPSTTPLIGERVQSHSQSNASFTTPVSAEIFVVAGDVIRISANTHVSDTGAVLNVTHQEQRIQVAVSNVTPQYEDADSMVRVQNANGYGSTNIAIRRFTNVLSNIGSAIIYTDSATDGGSFTVQEDGFYTISYTGSGGSNFYAGLSLNSTELSTDIQAITPADILAFDFEGIATGVSNASWSGILNSGDIIRAHNNKGNGANDDESFTIAKVGVPSIAEVDVTPFVDLQDQGWKVNSLKLEGNGGQVVGFSVKTPFNGGGKGWSGDTYTIQNDNAVIEFKASCTFTVSVLRIYVLYKNGVSYKRLGDNATDNTHPTSFTSSVGEFSKGDELSIRLENGSGTLSNNPARHYLNLNEWYRADQYERIYAVEQNENEFSARIDDTGSIVSQSLNFIDSVTKITGEYTVNLIDGFFTELPAATATADVTGSSGNVIICDIELVDLNTIKVYTDTSGASAFDEGFTLKLSRQGADRKDLQRQLASISDFPRVNNQLTQSLRYDTHAGYGSTNTKIPYFTDITRNSGDSIVSIENSSVNGFSITALRDCVVSVIYQNQSTTSQFSGISKNSTQLTSNIDVVTTTDVLDIIRASSANDSVSNTITVKLKTGDVIRPHTQGQAPATAAYNKIEITAQAQELERVTNVDQQENVFSARIANNGTATVTSENYPFIDTVNRSSLATVDIVFKAGFFSVAPSVVGTSKTAGYLCNVTSLSTTGCTVETLDRGAGETDIDFDLTVTRQGDDYKSLTDIVLAIPDSQVAYLKDIKAGNTAGGTFTSGSYQTRDLSIVEGEGGIVSLSANQFTLGSGLYKINGIAPAVTVDQHQAKIRNITDSTDEILGTVVYSRATSGDQNNSVISGVIEITSNKTFELQHRCVTTAATFGYGSAPASTFGNDSVYSQIEITKLR